MVIKIALDINIGGEVNTAIKEMGESLYALSRDWPGVRDKEVEYVIHDVYVKEVLERTPMASTDRYGDDYSGSDKASGPGALRNSTDVIPLGQGIDRGGFKIIQNDVYTFEGTPLYEYYAKKWTTPGTGPYWFDWAWDNVREHFISRLSNGIEGAISNYIGVEMSL